MSGFPVQISGQGSPLVYKSESISDSVVNAEGTAYTANVTTTMTAINAATGNGLQIGATMNSIAGKAIKLSGFVICSSIQIDMFIRVNQTSLMTVIEKPVNITIPANTPTYIPIEWVIRSGYNVQVFAKKAYGSVDACVITNYALATFVTDDFTPNARKNILFIGDSITNGTGATYTWNMYQTMIKNHLRQNGVSCRYYLMGLSGSTTDTHIPLLAQGKYDIGSIDCVFVALGANDAKNGVLPATYKANLQKFIDWALNHPENKKMNICLIGTTPIQNVTAEANAVVHRAKITELVTENNNTRLFGFDFGGIYTDPTVFSNYLASDGNGSGIHPTDASHLLAFNKAKTFLQSTNGLRLISNLK